MMNATHEIILLTLTIAAFFPLFLLQFLPAKYTVSKGTLSSITTWREVVWSLPNHMLSDFGRKLRYTCLLLFLLDAIYLISLLIGTQS